MRCPECGLTMLLSDKDDKDRIVNAEAACWNTINQRIRDGDDRNSLCCPACNRTSSVLSWREHAIGSGSLCHEKINLMFKCHGLFLRIEHRGPLKTECPWCGSGHAIIVP